MSKSRRGNYQVSFEKIHKKSAPGPSSQARAAPCSVTQEEIQHNSAASMKMSSEVDALLPSVHPAGEHILAQSGGEVCVETEIKIKTTESNFLLPLSLSLSVSADFLYCSLLQHTTPLSWSQMLHEVWTNLNHLEDY